MYPYLAVLPSLWMLKARAMLSDYSSEKDHVGRDLQRLFVFF
jgi:hypothetical protein